MSPSCTVWPSATLISTTRPARGASTGISIFIDSRTITGSPSATASPSLLVIWKTTPVMWALTCSAIERSLFDHLRMDSPRPERLVPHHPLVEGDHGPDAVHREAVEGAAHPLDGQFAARARGDELREQRVVVYRNL